MNKEPRLDHAAKGGPPHVAGDASDVSQSAVPLDSDVCCPRCDYALRGAAALRCPECGLAFTLDELQRIADLPWLFDQAPRRKLLGAWWRTARRAIRPRDFWASIPLTLRPNAGRLVAYWLSFAVLTTCFFIVVFLLTIISLNLWFSYKYGRIDRLGWLDAVQEEFQFVRQALFSPQILRWAIRFALAVPVAVPAATLLTFVVCSKSLRSSRITIRHQLRIVCYTSPIILLSPICIGASMWAQELAFEYQLIRRPAFWDFLTNVSTEFAFHLILLTPLWIWFVRHLIAGLRNYGRFKHATSIVLTSQFIALLVTTNILLLFVLSRF